jgi:predicted ATPase
LLRQLAGLACQRPVLVIFEDLHWSDPTFRELLDRPLHRSSECPVLLVATFRPEFQPAWTGQPHVTTLTLRRLGRNESTELVRGVIGAAARLSGEVIDEIVERTDGVPLFLEELTKTVIETAVAGRELIAIPAVVSYGSGDTPCLATGAPRSPRPAAKEAAQVGATIGREFSYQLLAAAARRTDAELKDALSRLFDAGLVFQRGAPPQATLLFKHTLVRDTAYSTLLRGQRQGLHAQVGMALEDNFREVIETLPEILAYHFTEGGLVDKAVGTGCCRQKRDRPVGQS